MSYIPARVHGIASVSFVTPESVISDDISEKPMHKTVICRLDIPVYCDILVEDKKRMSVKKLHTPCLPNPDIKLVSVDHKYIHMGKINDGNYDSNVKINTLLISIYDEIILEIGYHDRTDVENKMYRTLLYQQVKEMATKTNTEQTANKGVVIEGFVTEPIVNQNNKVELIAQPVLDAALVVVTNFITIQKDSKLMTCMRAIQYLNDTSVENKVLLAAIKVLREGVRSQTAKLATTITLETIDALKTILTNFGKILGDDKLRDCMQYIQYISRPNDSIDDILTSIGMISDLLK